MRTPSMMNATTAAMKNTQTAYLTVPVANHVAADSTSAMINLINIGSLPGEFVSAGVFRRDPERIAMGRHYVQDRARLRGLIAFDLRVPGRPAIAHPREARSLVDPVLEICRLAGIDLLHLLRRAVDT